MKLVMMITFAVFTLANSACVKENGGPVQCCNQREHDGSLHCCAGRNNSCSMSTAGFVNARSSCYCDEYCKKAGDCCPDFESFNKTCDIDECRQQDRGGCSHGCVNTLGSYRCTCPNGFQLNNGRTCQDINECRQRDKGGCSHGCVNTLGSYRCTCPNCFQLNNGRTCQVMRRKLQKGQLYLRKFLSCFASEQPPRSALTSVESCLTEPFWNLKCKMARNACYYYVICDYDKQQVGVGKYNGPVLGWTCQTLFADQANPSCCDYVCPMKNSG